MIYHMDVQYWWATPDAVMLEPMQCNVSPVCREIISMRQAQSLGEVIFVSAGITCLVSRNPLAGSDASGRQIGPHHAVLIRAWGLA